MTRWELARYLIDAKKAIDTVLYVTEYGAQISNSNLCEKINDVRRKFYINCCVVLDKSFPKDKKRICENATICSVYYERDKNVAHKDEDYIKKEYVSLVDLTDDMKKQIETVKKVCANFLPEDITLDYVEFDSELFRIANGITKSIEDEIMLEKHPGRGMKITSSMPVKALPILNDTEDLRYIPATNRKKYATLFEMGINLEESLQKLQDGCVRTNLLYGENIWVSIPKENIKRQQHLREIGLYDLFDRPAIPTDEASFNEFVRILRSEGLLDK